MDGCKGVQEPFIRRQFITKDGTKREEDCLLPGEFVVISRRRMIAVLVFLCAALLCAFAAGVLLFNDTNGYGQQCHGNNGDNYGRRLLQHIEPPTPKTVKSLVFDESDSNVNDYPNPGPSPTPDNHDYPPPAYNYLNSHGRRLLQYMEPPTPKTEKSLDFGDSDSSVNDYPNPGLSPTPDNHDYPRPAALI